MIEYKAIINSVKDVDTTTRRVKVAMSEVDTKDLDEDVIDNGAYKKTVKERGPVGSKLIWHLTDHIPLLKNAVGKPNSVEMDGKYLVFITDIPKTAWGDDVLTFYQNGDINQHSVGFTTMKDEVINKGHDDEYRLIKEIMLYEGSAVLWGANPNTPTISVGKSLLSDTECPHCHKMTKNSESGMGYIKCTHCQKTFSSQLAEYSKTIDELNKLSKMFKAAYLTDETYGLIELKISQLSDKLQLLFNNATQPVDETVKPVNNANEALAKALTTFQNSLKLNNGRHSIIGSA